MKTGTLFADVLAAPTGLLHLLRRLASLRSSMETT